MTGQLAKIARFLRGPLPLLLRRFFLDGVVVGSAGLVLFWYRWPVIVYPLTLNPYEMQATADVLRGLADGFNWDSLDGTTVGPLNTLVLAWPRLLGLDATLSTTRLTGCVLLYCICIFSYLYARRLVGRLFATLLLLPLLLSYALATHPDLLHYTSETFPLALLVLANYLLLAVSLNKGDDRTLPVLLLGVLLGCVPFAKLQAGPVALLVGLFALLCCSRRTPPRRLRLQGALLVGSILPAVLFLLPLLFKGAFGDFWRGYIVWAGVYVKETLSVLALHKMVTLDPALKYTTYFLVTLCALIPVQAVFFPAEKAAAEPLVRTRACYALLLTIAVFWVILWPGNSFPHYLSFYSPFLVILGASLAVYVRDSRVGRVIFVACYVALAAVFAFTSATDRAGRDAFRVSRKRFATVLPQGLVFRNPRLFSWMPNPSGRLLVWGWMPQWYVEGNLAPATRESHTNSQILKTKLTPYFRGRFLRDLRASAPGIILDAARGRSAVYSDPSFHSPAGFKELMREIGDKYFLVLPMQASEDCARLYIRKDLGLQLGRSLVTPKTVSATMTHGGDASPFRVTNLFDNSVTEDTCTDYWLLPDGNLGSVRMELEGAEKISRVMLLNTRGSQHLDRSTNEMSLTLSSAGTVVSRSSLGLEPYPLWTEVSFDPPIVSDQIDLRVISFSGQGGGLNEVKIFRADGSSDLPR